MTSIENVLVGIRPLL